MSSSVYAAFGALALVAPFLAIAAILLHGWLRQSLARRAARRYGKRLHVYSSSAALAAAFLFVSVLYQPSSAHFVEARQRADVEDDDGGDPDSPSNQLRRQLRMIRRGEPVDTLIVRR